MNPNEFKSGMGPMTDRLLNGILDVISKENFSQRFTQIVNDRVQPYVHIGMFMYAVVIVLLLVIIYLLYDKKKII
uniref:Uncharacterized protein n=1 Tax=viral metagenome TaxID=1070528 RepID=A0A6C0C9B4_9ZZZZ